MVALWCFRHNSSQSWMRCFRACRGGARLHEDSALKDITYDDLFIASVLPGPLQSLSRSPTPSPAIVGSRQWHFVAHCGHRIEMMTAMVQASADIVMAHLETVRLSQ
eukprot:6455290-Amphidinium_carterae.1